MFFCKRNHLALLALSSLSVSAFADNGMDARGMGMGGTGVASAHYLTAGFYNPALAVNYKANDDFGLMLPSIGVTVHDADDLYHKVDHFQEINSDIEDSIDNGMLTAAQKEEWTSALNELDNGSLKATVHAGIAASVPNHYLSAVLFTQAQVQAVVNTDIDQRDIQHLEDFDTTPEHMYSTVEGLAGGTADIGIALAKSFDLPFDNQTVSLGVAPKLQKIYALRYKKTVEEFEDSDFDAGHDHTEKTAFNLDLGIAYKPVDSITVAFAAKNVIKQSLDTNKNISRSDSTAVTYLVEPKYTAGVAYDNGMFTLAADVDLNKQHYFEELAYETQFAHLGAEFNAWDWAQLRAGYSISMTDYAQNMVTAGIGLKPFGAFGIDLAGQYGEDNNYGAAVQFVITL
ncbi:conjugal transfer protein TraF [Photobacterium damselae]|uniref:conjugal transfer protein TraF n=1 Tax=Photobacterium damselae TaxID=38293 RepID=UPI001EFE506C|nr:conjugal transfer protein TraF [Photobacterium damselae]MCG9707058.1 conjugal transfer protein TraF [Photobacterium damselae]